MVRHSHKAKAEQILAGLYRFPDAITKTHMIARAQAHATLALVEAIEAEAESPIRVLHNVADDVDPENFIAVLAESIGHNHRAHGPDTKARAVYQDLAEAGLVPYPGPDPIEREETSQ